MSAKTSGRTEALRRLDVLIGRWDTEAVVEGRSVGVAWTEFEWADGDTFVRQTADGATITAMWEFSDDGETWRKDFDLIYRRPG